MTRAKRAAELARCTRAVADEARWQNRWAALVKYRAARHDWPRHKACEEHQPGVWLHARRYKHRHGELEPAKAQSPDESLPGWRDGRRQAGNPRNGAE